MSFSIEQEHITFFGCFARRFRDITYAKNLCFLSRQHVTPKAVISLKIQQNIDLSQRAALTMLISGKKPLKYRFHVNVRPQRR